MQEEQKEVISKAVKEWVDQPNQSTNKLSEKSKVNSRYIIEIAQGNTTFKQGDKEYDIRAENYYKLANAMELSLDKTVHFSNKNFEKVQRACAYAQGSKRRVLLDSTDSGAGKTYSLEHYAKNHQDVLYIKVNHMMKGYDLVSLLMEKIHFKNHTRQTAHTILKTITNRIIENPNYLIILDEMEGSRADMIRVLKDLEDATYRKCGMVLSGMGLIEEFASGEAKGRKLMPQLARRFRGTQVLLRGLSRNDIKKVCLECGIEDTGAIRVVQDQVRDYSMLSEWVHDIKASLIEKGIEVNQETVSELFLATD